MFKNYTYDNKSEKHSFEINDVDLSIINGIRRTILTDIPIIGFIGEEEPSIEIIYSDGPLHNEFLIHRIGLIPVNIEENELDNYIDDDLIFEINEKNDTKNIKSIYTDCIIGKRKGVNITKKELEKIFPKNNITKSNILITKLRPDESLQCRMIGKKRTARFNASFCPTSLCNLSYIQDPKLADKETDILNKERLYYMDKYNEPNKIKFDLEIINGINVKYLFIKSIDIITDKLNNLINDLNNNLIKIEKFQNLESTVEFHIDNEDDTIGNIIQSITHNNYIRNNNKYMDNIICSYIGYICPYPLKYLMVLRITLENQKDIKIFSNFLIDICKNIIYDINNIKSEFIKFKI